MNLLAMNLFVINLLVINLLAINLFVMTAEKGQQHTTAAVAVIKQSQLRQPSVNIFYFLLIRS